MSRAATKAANRATILAAAREAFAGEAGFAGTSVRDIVRRTDLASGTFYNYFPDKATVFRALVEDVGAQARRRVRAARRGATSTRAFVEDGYRAYFSFIVEDPVRFAFIARNAAVIRERFGDAVLPEGTSELREDLEEAIAAGVVPAVDAELCAHAMTAVGFELGQRLVEREPPDVERATAFATGLFLGGLEALAAQGSGKGSSGTPWPASGGSPSS
jgi:AcrR family transcriptional regulator